MIAAVEARGIRAGCDLLDHLAHVEEGIAERRAAFEDRERGEAVEVDPLGQYLWHGDLEHPRRRRIAA